MVETGSIGLTYDKLRKFSPEVAVDSKAAEFFLHGAHSVLRRQGIEMDQHAAMPTVNEEGELLPFDGREIVRSVVANYGRDTAFQAVYKAKRIVRASDLNGWKKPVLNRLGDLREEIDRPS